MGGGGAVHELTYQFCAGFIDQVYRFQYVEPIWQIMGSMFFLVTFFSFIPQTAELVAARSSFGIESISIFCESLAHFLLVVNVISLNAWDFVGYFQYPHYSAFPRMLTFMNLFFQWAMFIPTIYQAFIFHDRHPRPGRDRRETRVEWLKTVGVAIVLTIVDISLLGIFALLSMKFGFESAPVYKYAQACGIVATVLEVGFFLPQLYTTCKLRDGGALSLIMLEIQGPADVCNALYMWLGTKDDWTTWLTVLVGGIENFTLLGTCLLFKCMKARAAAREAAEKKRNMVMLASIEPGRISVSGI